MNIQRLTTEDLKKAIKSGEDLEGVVGVKYTAATVEKEAADDAERILTYTISTKDVDRDGDTIDPTGWDLANFIKGGSVLWAHMADATPVAKPLATWVEDGKLKSRAQFTPREVNDFGFMIYQMARDGYVRGASVGFIPKQWVENGERSGFMPIDFVKQELLEWSVTPVASNPNALVEARAKGIDVSPMRAWAERFLDGETESGLLVSKSLVEELYAGSREQKTAVVVTRGDGDDPAPEPDIPSPEETADSDPPADPGDALPEPTANGDAGEQTDPPKDEAAAIAEALKTAEDHIARAVTSVTTLAEQLHGAVKMFVETLGKSGRVLSAANEQKLRDAVNLLSQVISQVESQDPEDDDEKLTIAIDFKAEDQLSITRDDVAGLVEESMNRVIRQRTGRVD